MAIQEHAVSLEDQIEQLNDQKAGFDAQAEAAKTQQTLIGNLAELPTRPLPPAAAGAPSSGDDWPKILALIAQATGDASKPKRGEMESSRSALSCRRRCCVSRRR